MLNQLKHAMRRKNHLEMAQEELEMARRERLVAQTAQEWAISMVAYHTSRIERLEEYVKGLTNHALQR